MVKFKSAEEEAEWTAVMNRLMFEQVCLMEERQRRKKDDTTR